MPSIVFFLLLFYLKRNFLNSLPVSSPSYFLYLFSYVYRCTFYSVSVLFQTSRVPFRTAFRFRFVATGLAGSVRRPRQLDECRMRRRTKSKNEWKGPMRKNISPPKLNFANYLAWLILLFFPSPLYINPIHVDQNFLYDWWA